MSDDRSDRLRKRRQNRDKEDTESSKQASAPNGSETTAATDSGTENSSVTVKEALQGIYLYGEPDQKDRIDLLYNRLKADYEYEYNDVLGKNEHFYRVLLEVGLEGLESMDVSELRERLESLESLESLHNSDN